MIALGAAVIFLAVAVACLLINVLSLSKRVYEMEKRQ